MSRSDRFVHNTLVTQGVVFECNITSCFTATRATQIWNKRRNRSFQLVALSDSIPDRLAMAHLLRRYCANHLLSSAGQESNSSAFGQHISLFDSFPSHVANSMSLSAVLRRVTTALFPHVSLTSPATIRIAAETMSSEVKPQSFNNCPRSPCSMNVSGMPRSSMSARTFLS